MKSFYRTLQSAEHETVIKKSRFKAFIFNIKSEDDAKQILSNLTEKFRDATHICYAYVVSLDANIERFSDDGEPSGTAGVPILEAIKNSGCSEILAAVVRYFGGVKLGAGGLARAYAESVKNCIAKALPIEFILSVIYEISLDFSQAKKIRQLLSNIVCKTLEISYNEVGVLIKLALPVDTDFERLVADFTADKVKPQKVGMEYIEYDSSQSFVK